MYYDVCVLFKHTHSGLLISHNVITTVGRKILTCESFAQVFLGRKWCRGGVGYTYLAIKTIIMIL